MAKRKKNESVSNSQVVSSIEENETEITYKEFFQSCLVRGKVMPWQEKEVQAFFRSLGLKDKETTHRYADALRKY